MIHTVKRTQIFNVTTEEVSKAASENGLLYLVSPQSNRGTKSLRPCIEQVETAKFPRHPTSTISLPWGIQIGNTVVTPSARSELERPSEKPNCVGTLFSTVKIHVAHCISAIWTVIKTVALAKSEVLLLSLVWCCTRGLHRHIMFSNNLLPLSSRISPK